MESKSVKLSWILLIVPSIILMLYGVSVLLGPGTYAEIYFQPTGQPWAEFNGANPNVANLIIQLFLGLGIGVLTIGFLTASITLTAYRKGERWAWYVLLVGVTLAWGGDMVLEIRAGEIAYAFLTGGMVLLSWLGLAISAKAILGKTPATGQGDYGSVRGGTVPHN